jgi:hypothetical protein
MNMLELTTLLIQGKYTQINIHIMINNYMKVGIEQTSETSYSYIKNTSESGNVQHNVIVT